MIPHLDSAIIFPVTAFDRGDYTFFDLLDTAENSTRFYMLVLYALARSQGLRHVVELGTYRGNTARLLGRAMLKNGGRLEVYDHDPHWCQALKDSLLPAAPVWVHERSTHDVIGDPHPDLVFVDADHSYEGVSADWAAWAPRVTLGGFMAFHDMSENPDVRRWANETFPHPAWEHVAMPGDAGLLLTRKIAG